MSELRGSCHMCGRCCEAIHINQSAEEIANRAKPMLENGQTDMDNDILFIHLNWKPITKEEAQRINPHLAENERYVKENWSDSIGYEKLHFYTCTHYDKENHKCAIHEIRPHVCSGYPWYGKPPEPTHLFYSEDCGYKVDVEDITRQNKENERTVYAYGNENIE